MNKLEQAARQALDALGGNDSDFNIKHYEAITALREAIAEQAEQEPVAWLWVNEQGSERLEWESVQDISKWKATPLYAAPVRTKDLTDDEIRNALLSVTVGYGVDSLEPIRAVIDVDREKNK